MYGPHQTPWLAWLQAALAITALVLAILTFSQAGANRELQKAAALNATRLARAGAFANLDNGLIQLTAKTAVDSNDAALTQLLAQNGVTFRNNAAKAPPAAGANP